MQSEKWKTGSNWIKVEFDCAFSGRHSHYDEVTSSMHNPFVHINNNIMNINCSCCSTMLHCSQKLWSRAKAIEWVYWIQQIDRTKTKFFSLFFFWLLLTLISTIVDQLYPTHAQAHIHTHSFNWHLQRASYHWTSIHSTASNSKSLMLCLCSVWIFLNGAHVYGIQSHLMMNPIFTWIFTERRKTWPNRNPVNYRIPYGKINCAFLARWENGRKPEPCNISLHLFTCASAHSRSYPLFVGIRYQVSQQCTTDTVRTPRLQAYS